MTREHLRRSKPSPRKMIAHKEAVKAFLACGVVQRAPGSCASPESLRQAANALLSLNTYLSRDEEDPETCCLLGDADYAQGSLGAALWWYEHSVLLWPCYLDGYLGMARVFRQQGRTDEATKTLEQALGIDPLHPYTHHLLGLVYGDRGELAMALTALQRSLHLSPQDAWAWHNLAVTYHRLGELELADAAYRSALEIDADIAPARTNLVSLAGEILGATDSGSVDCQPAENGPVLEYQPTIVMPDALAQLEAHFHRWNEYLDEDRLDKLRAEVDAMMRIDPTHWTTRVARPTTACRLGARHAAQSGKDA
jgi:Tfp pilus assembly protein PilF